MWRTQISHFPFHKTNMRQKTLENLDPSLWNDLPASIKTTNNLKIFKHTLREKCPIRSSFWSLFSCIQTEYRKKRTRNNSVFRHLSRSDNIKKHITSKQINHNQHCETSKQILLLLWLFRPSVALLLSLLLS